MSQDIANAKDLVRRFQAALDAAGPGADCDRACAEFHAGNHAYRGMSPFYDLSGAAALSNVVWSPLKRAMPALQRRPDIFFASRDDHRSDAPVWVVSMGNFIGDFTETWLGIPPTGRATYLPYAALNRVEDGRIAETVEFLDILAVLTQAGLNPYAAVQSGGHIMSPGPKTHDGLLHAAQPDADSGKSHALTVRMLTELADGYTSTADHMERNWHRDMTWFGPTGIGASLGFPGYVRGHTGPFNDKQDIVEILDWEIALAEGHFSAVMWWPCLRMRNTGDYLGVPANDALAEMRVLDLYRRDGDKLAENWIFIDILHFLKMQRVDLLQDIEG